MIKETHLSYVQNGGQKTWASDGNADQTAVNLLADHTMDVENQVDEKVRVTWSRKAEYVLSMMGYGVGLGNIWRFPYVCIRNGGGRSLLYTFKRLRKEGITSSDSKDSEKKASHNQIQKTQTRRHHINRFKRTTDKSITSTDSKDSDKSITSTDSKDSDKSITSTDSKDSDKKASHQQIQKTQTRRHHINRFKRLRQEGITSTDSKVSDKSHHINRFKRLRQEHHINRFKRLRQEHHINRFKRLRQEHHINRFKRIRTRPTCIGVGQIIVNVICAWYYILLIAWVLIYLVHSFRSPLPWTLCGQGWNTPACVPQGQRVGLTGNDTNSTSLGPDNATAVTSEGYDLVNGSRLIKPLRPAGEEFWVNNVLELSSGLDNLDGLPWHTTLALLVACVLVLLCIVKGVKSVGKVVYVTATFPYILLTIFIVTGATLPGAQDGVLFYLKPDF
uniref:Transporter n=1 Tax=Biomphalaria glabrata TaxID=6526 RepID=A0A2C9KEE4_BIOGL